MVSLKALSLFCYLFLLCVLRPVSSSSANLTKAEFMKLYIDDKRHFIYDRLLERYAQATSRHDAQRIQWATVDIQNWPLRSTPAHLPRLWDNKCLGILFDRVANVSFSLKDAKQQQLSYSITQARFDAFRWTRSVLPRQYCRRQNCLIDWKLLSKDFNLSRFIGKRVVYAAWTVDDIKELYDKFLSKFPVDNVDYSRKLVAFIESSSQLGHDSDNVPSSLVVTETNISGEKRKAAPLSAGKRKRRRKLKKGGRSSRGRSRPRLICDCSQVQQQQQETDQDARPCQSGQYQLNDDCDDQSWDWDLDWDFDLDFDPEDMPPGIEA